MILLEIDVLGVAIDEFEGNAPWSVDVHRLAFGFSQKPMKIKAGKVQFLGAFYQVEAVQTLQDAIVQSSIDLAPVAGP